MRGSAFYLATLCFFTNLISEVQVWKSTDGGQTWTDSTKDAIVSFSTYGCFIGDYNAIAASDEVSYPVWTDGRNTPGRPLGQTDIFTNVEIQQ